MPDLVVLVTGTDTGVGKTWLTARMAAALRRTALVCARKPAQSFDAGDRRTDADALAAVTAEDPEAVCPSHRSYPLAMAPPMAADALGRPSVRVNDLMAELSLPPAGIALVEGVGGVRSPLAHDGDNIALAQRLQPDLVVLVASCSLGVINAALLAADALEPWPLLIFLNHFDADSELHVRSRAWLTGHDLDVVTSVGEVTARIALLYQRGRKGPNPNPSETEAG